MVKVKRGQVKKLEGIYYQEQSLQLEPNIYHLLQITCIYPNYITRCNHSENKERLDILF